MKIETINSSTIDAIKYLLSYTPDETKRKELITKNCKKYVLTPEFIMEFKPYLTKEMFSSSPYLSEEMVNKYPELFDEEVFKTNPYKDFSLLMSGYIPNISPEIYFETLKRLDSSKITPEIFKFFMDMNDKNCNSVLFKLAPAELLNPQFLLEHVDKITDTIFENHNLETLFLDTDFIDQLFAKKTNLDFSFIIKALVINPDTVWAANVLSAALNWNLINYSGCLDNEMGFLAKKLLIGDLGKLFDFSKKFDPMSLSFNFLNMCLSIFDLSEDFCMTYADVFKNNNLKHALYLYCKDKDYKNCILLLAMD
jgi:hypothetical protein